MQKEIDNKDREITLLKSIIDDEVPDAFKQQEIAIAKLERQLELKDKEKDIGILNKQIRELEKTVARQERELKSKFAEIKQKEMQITALSEPVREDPKKLELAEMYRRELAELRFKLQDQPQVIYRNAPLIEVFKKSDIKVIYVEKAKRGKSKEQQAFIRKYKKVRLDVLERDNYKCIDCGRDEDLHVHHIIHKSDGGTNDPNNLVTLCKWCHAERHKGEAVYNIMAKALR